MMMKRKPSIAYYTLAVFLLEVVLLLCVVVYRDRVISLYLLVVAILMLMLNAMFFYFRMYKPLRMLGKKVSALEKGEVERVEPTRRRDELGVIENLLHSHVNRIEELIVLMNEFGEGKIERDFPLLSSNDELGEAVSKLKQSIIRNNTEAAKRMQIDEQRNWAAEGLAKFSEITRDFHSDIQQHASKFMRELCTYLKVEVGGLFLVEEGMEKPELVLEGAYAFDREKQLQKKFDFGEGLVGRCAVEEESIVITDVPKEYVKIRSGMGEDNPTTLVFVPMMLDGDVVGVIELATFDEVPDYKIEFLESLSLSVAGSVGKR